MHEDAKQIADLLDVVTARVPQLLRSLMDLVYSPEAGRNVGLSVGGFYKELLAAGIPAEDALKLAAEYLAPLRLLQSLALNQTQG